MEGSLAMSDQRFDELLAACLENEISEQELTELHKIVHASESMQRRFQEETRLHVLLRENLVEQIELQEIHRSATRPRRRAFPRRVHAAAVAAAALLIISSAIAYLVYRPDTDSAPHIGICMSVSGSGNLSIQRGSQHHRATAETPLLVGDRVVCEAHTQAMLRLADGSILAMEPGSALTLVSDRPEVSLQKGEVLFEIAPRVPDASAFQVLTGQSTVAVMGTVFSLTANGHTEVKVYEGSVSLTRHRDNATVKVGSQQMATTAAEDLTVESLSLRTSASSTELVSLTPTDDMTLDQGQRDAAPRLKVEGGRRTVYLRFDVPDVGVIRSARLRLTQDVDPGEGTLRFFTGEHVDWSENDLAEDSAPIPLRLVGQYAGVVRLGQTVEVDVSDAVKKAGPLTLIMTLDKTRENDIWFASKESDFPPQLILTCVRHGYAADEPTPRKAPYPPSKVIAGITWAPKESIIRLANGSDNFPLTWADDGHLYTTWGDGNGFSNVPRRSMGYARIEGTPPRVNGVDIRSEQETLGDGRKGKKGWGLLCVDDVLYLWMGHADGRGGQAQLAWSRDHAKTWEQAQWRFSEFGLVGFVNFGQNYEDAQDNYVYAYSHDGPKADTPADRFVLMRVPEDQIASRDAYEFFAGLDDHQRPLWSSDITERSSVFEHRDGCLRSAMSWNAKLRRYLWWQHVPQPPGHKDRGDTRFEGGFGVYDAPHPWGPWTTVFFTPRWDIGPGEHGDFPTKWISPDGRSAQLVFSGDDCFSIRGALFELRSD